MKNLGGDLSEVIKHENSSARKNKKENKELQLLIEDLDVSRN